MLSADELGAQRANPRFLIDALQRRGVDVEVFDFQEQVFRAELAGHEEWIFDGNCTLLNLPLSAIANNKWLAKETLSLHGINVPEGRRFTYAQINEALVYARILGFPVTVKPCTQSRGMGVRAGLRDLDELEESIDAVCTRGPPLFVLEQHVRGEELRVFVTRHGGYAVVRREAASVVGDGTLSLADLAAAETARRLAPGRTCLGAIELDPWHLERAGRSAGDVPQAGEKVFVRGHVEALGAFVEDVTDDVHPSLIDVCRRALAAFAGLSHVGFDLITCDRRAPQTHATYWVLEANTNPALGMHIAPGRGRGRDVASSIADMLFPETMRGAPPDGAIG